jgi:beta-aspartyl-peptidase (threonine type)
MPARRGARPGGAERRPRVAGRAWSLAIHGGAGEPREHAGAREAERARRDVLHEVLAAGARALAAGAASLDVVEDAVRALEDSPLFNAGKGAVFNARGAHELEASIMDGRTLAAGAVANLRGIKNPVTLARWVMERSPHVYLAGDGAIAFAQEQGMALVAPDYFWTEESWSALKRARLGASDARRAPPPGTVGAVALDVRGNLAAATSTGGTTRKLPGRVGDSSVIGAGTYASNASCAVSCTGLGEYFIRAAAARDICALVEYERLTARAAASKVLRKIARLGGRGGAIVVDRRGAVACLFNTELMYRGSVTHSQPIRTSSRRRPSL